MKYIYENNDVSLNLKNKDKIYIGIVGTRNATIKHYSLIKLTALQFLNSNKIDINNVILVSGGAKGVDTLAEKLANELNIDIIVIKPNYKKYLPKKAPLERNKIIAKLADYLIAFPDKNKFWSGTHQCVNEFKNTNKNSERRLEVIPIEVNI